MPLYSFSYCIPYLIFFFILYIFSYKAGITRFYDESLLFRIKNIFLFFVFLFFFGTRGFINTDFIGYTKFYQNLPSIIDNNFLEKALNNNFEKGFVFYTGIIKSFAYDNYFIFQFINSLIDFLILKKLFEEYNNQRYVSLAWLCFFLWGALSFSVNLVRNVKALVIFLLSLRCYNKKKYTQFVFLNAIAFLFHSAAIVYIISLPFILRRHKRKTFTVFFLIGNIFYIGQIHWITTLLLKLVEIFHFGRLSMMLNFYLNSDIYASSFGFSIGYLERFFIAVLVLYYYEKLMKLHSFAFVWVNSFFIYILITLFCSELMIVISRVALLFMYGYWFIVPMLYSEMNKKIKFIFLLFLLMYGSLKLIKGQSRIISKYDSFLSLNMMTLQERTPYVYKFLNNEEKNK